MGRKKKEKIEGRIIKTIKGRRYEVVYKTVECLKPLPNEDGKFYILDVLNYLTKIVPQSDSSFKTILSLASYLAYNGGCPASESQNELIAHFVEYWQDRDVLDIDGEDRG